MNIYDIKIQVGVFNIEVFVMLSKLLIVSV